MAEDPDIQNKSKILESLDSVARSLKQWQDSCARAATGLSSLENIAGRWGVVEQMAAMPTNPRLATISAGRDNYDRFGGVLHIFPGIGPKVAVEHVNMIEAAVEKMRGEIMVLEKLEKGMEQDCSIAMQAIGAVELAERDSSRGKVTLLEVVERIRRCACAHGREYVSKAALLQNGIGRGATTRVPMLGDMAVEWMQAEVAGSAYDEELMSIAVLGVP